MIKRSGFSVVFCFLFLIAGCASLQPSGSHVSSIGKPPWNNYEEFSGNIGKIVLYKTTFDDLKAIGFNPVLIPNTEVIKDVRMGLLPRRFDSIDTLPIGARVCYKYFLECKGYSFTVDVLDVHGEGSVILRLLNMKRIDITTGWRGALDVYVLPRKLFPRELMEKLVVQGVDQEDDMIVAFMLLGGVPNIQQVIIKKTPLGFVDPITGVGKKLSPAGAPNFNTE